MSRLNVIINRLEMAAKRLGMSIEEAVLILEGEHSTHSVMKRTEVSNPIIPTPAPAPLPEPANPITSTPVAASGVASTQSGAASTEPTSPPEPKIQD